MTTRDVHAILSSILRNLYSWVRKRLRSANPSSRHASGTVCPPFSCLIIIIIISSSSSTTLILQVESGGNWPLRIWDIGAFKRCSWYICNIYSFIVVMLSCSTRCHITWLQRLSPGNTACLSISIVPHCVVSMQYLVNLCVLSVRST